MVNEMVLLAILTLLKFSVVLGKPFPRQHVVTTIQMNNGQIFKCVDIYKQPAFDDPSLNLQNVPNLIKLQQQQNVNEDFGFQGRGCPLGTVPILEQPKTYVNNASNVLGSKRWPHLQAGIHCSAKIQTKEDPDNIFYGAESCMTVYKPFAQESQWSSTRIKLLNADESIEAGWMVNPNEFKDIEAHLYASFSAGDKGCINVDCPGFIQVSKNIPLGVAAPEYSHIDDQRPNGWSITIEKHSDDGNWWLSILNQSIQKEGIGYWPKELFKNLSVAANRVEFGGEVDNPNQSSPVPWMGAGYMASYDTKTSSFFSFATVIDANSNHINPPDTEKFEDCDALYTVLDGGTTVDPHLGRLIFYGGPQTLFT
ncbi:hypothetical protein vseg_008626 [Gypsophila vaccaria]